MTDRLKEIEETLEQALALACVDAMNAPRRCVMGLLKATSIEKAPKMSEGDKWLVLTRKVGEQLTIGDDITITVVRVKGKQVRLGIKAPVNMFVKRVDSQPGEEGAEDDEEA